MKTYFDYESVIKSKDAVEAIAAPMGVGPFCGFGSATVNNNSITLYPNGEPDSPLYQAIKDRIIARYMSKGSESGETPDTNFGCIARDGAIFISDSAEISIPNIEGSKGSNEDVLVFAYHTPLEEPVQNPIQFRAFWNESESFYTLYKKSVDPSYPIKKSDRKITPLENSNDLTYKSLSDRAFASISQGLVDKSSMVLVGIYGQGINALDSSIEKYSIVPYSGKFPQPMEYNTTVDGFIKSAVETLARMLQEIPNQNIKDYIDSKLNNTSSSSNTSNIPRGLIAMWNGIQVPDGWALCNGQIIDNIQTPNLSGKFIVGWSSGEEDYKNIGNTGGSNSITLSAAELPAHTHQFEDAYYIENPRSIRNTVDGSKKIGNNLTGGGDSDNDNDTVCLWKHDTESTGDGAAHENRPPYYVLAYIIKL